MLVKYTHQIGIICQVSEKRSCSLVTFLVILPLFYAKFYAKTVTILLILLPQF